MLTLETDLRWQRLWWLLSLEDSLAFFEELWIPFRGKQLSDGLRGVLRRWEKDPEFYLSNPSQVSYECFRWFEVAFGSEQMQVLVGWANSV